MSEKKLVIQEPKSLHQLAIEISKIEGKKKEVDIAQISEVIKCLRIIIKKYPITALKLLLR